MIVLLLLYVTSIWLTLFSAWKIANLSGCSREGCAGAATVLALTLTMPVAGTSLLLMDPYVTARSISTPCSLLALVGVLRMLESWEEGRGMRWGDCGLVAVSLFVAVIAHPLMGGYALGCVILMACLSLRNPKWKIISTVGVCLLSFGLAAFVSWLAPAQSGSYTEAAQTRTYWFLDDWHWYEWVGLIAPLCVLAALWGQKRKQSSQADAGAHCTCGRCDRDCGGRPVARESSRTYEVARLQPLRIYQMIFLLTLMAIGAMLGEWVLRRSVGRWRRSAARWAGACCWCKVKPIPTRRIWSSHGARTAMDGNRDLYGSGSTRPRMQCSLWMRTTSTPREKIRRTSGRLRREAYCRTMRKMGARRRLRRTWQARGPMGKECNGI